MSASPIGDDYRNQAGSAAAALITFNSAAALTGISSLQSSLSITFNPAAALTGLSSLSASSNVSLSATGVVTGRGEIHSTSSVAFLTNGTLTGDDLIAGSSVFEFIPSGNLIDAPSNNIAGSITLTFALLGKARNTQSFLITPNSIPSNIRISPCLVSGKFNIQTTIPVHKHVIVPCER